MPSGAIGLGQLRVGQVRDIAPDVAQLPQRCGDAIGLRHAGVAVDLDLPAVVIGQQRQQEKTHAQCCENPGKHSRFSASDPASGRWVVGSAGAAAAFRAAGPSAGFLPGSRAES